MPPALIIPPHNQAGGNNIYGNPRQDNVTLNKLEGVEVHDGVPIPFFKQTWIKAFKKGLVSKTQDGYTMVSVFEGTHMGGPTWVASNNALPAVPAAGPVAGTIYQLPASAASQLKYPWLGNKTLTEIRDAVAKSSKKDVAKTMFADVAEIITAIDEAGTDKESESDDHEYNLNFLSELNFGADEDGDEKPDDEPDSDEQE